jgi:hypothetical protein
MKRTVLAATLLCVGCDHKPAASGTAPKVAVQPDTVDLGVGTVELPKGFTHSRDEGIDSLVGQFTSPDGTLVIRYDIGPGAGVYATYPSHKPVVSSAELKAGQLTGQFTVLGATTQTAIVSFPTVGPTNFTTDASKEGGIETLKKLASTFKPKARENQP